jgi:hypothetical protein
MNITGESGKRELHHALQFFQDEPGGYCSYIVTVVHWYQKGGRKS